MSVVGVQIRCVGFDAFIIWPFAVTVLYCSPFFFYATLFTKLRRKVQWARTKKRVGKRPIASEFHLYFSYYFFFLFCSFRLNCRHFSNLWIDFWFAFDNSYFCWFSDYTLDFTSLIIDWTSRWMGRAVHSHTHTSIHIPHACEQCLATYQTRRNFMMNTEIWKGPSKSRRSAEEKKKTHCQTNWIHKMQVKRTFDSILLLSLLLLLWLQRLCEWTSNEK